MVASCPTVSTRARTVGLVVEHSDLEIVQSCLSNLLDGAVGPLDCFQTLSGF